MTPKEVIKQKALNLGFDLVGVTTADPLGPDQAHHLRTWIDRGYAGDMAYLEKNLAKRLDPRLLLDGTCSTVLVGLNYKQTPRSGPRPPAAGRVAHYARMEDYHGFMKQRLFQLGDVIVSTLGDDVRFKVCVDTVPLAERSLAQRAGLGFIGRNHMLIHPDLGPELFLGAILMTALLPPDETQAGDCGECQRCQKACPTGALRSDGFLDATRCINYLTIEHQGRIPKDFHKAIGHQLYGCDVCVKVCPYYEKAPHCSNTELETYPERAYLALGDIETWSRDNFARSLQQSPMLRLGLDRLQRNARICWANMSRL